MVDGAVVGEGLGGFVARDDGEAGVIEEAQVGAEEPGIVIAGRLGRGGFERQGRLKGSCSQDWLPHGDKATLG